TTSEGRMKSHLVSKGTNINHEASFKVRPPNVDHPLTTVQKMPHTYSGKPSSLTTVTIDYTGDACTPTLSWSGTGKGHLNSKGKDGILGSGSWAMVSAALLQGRVD